MADPGPKPPFENPEARTERLNTKAAGVIGLAVMCSRLLGLAREQICAALFGGGSAMDAFTVAFRIPNLLRALFAEGALSTAFVTTFTKTIAPAAAAGGGGRCVEGGAVRLADSHHVSVHPSRISRGAGHGHAERQERVRQARNG